MKKRRELTEKEIKTFFKKYSFSELERLQELIKCTCDEDYDDAAKMLEEEKSKKDSERSIVDETYRMKDLSDLEFFYLYDIVDKANLFYALADYSKFKDDLASSDKLLDLMDAEQKSRNDKKKEAPYGMTEDDLYLFFSKYNIVELDGFTELFEYVFNSDMTDAEEMLAEVRERKYRKQSESTTPVETSFKPSSLANKNDMLSLKELNFLYEIVSNHYDGIMSERDIQLDDYINDISLLMSSIKDFIDKRSEKTTNKVYTKNKEA